MAELIAFSHAVQTAANAIGYALESEGLSVSPEAALRAAQRLEDQGLLGTATDITRPEPTPSDSGVA